MLRLLTVLAIVCALVVPARAEPTVPVTAELLRKDMPPEARGLLGYSLQRQADYGRGLRNGGIATTVMGIVFTIVGTGLLVYSLDCYDCRGSSVGGGIALTTLGPLATIIGAPMWGNGQSRLTRAERAKLAISASGIRLTF